MLSWLSFLSWSSQQLVEPCDDYKVWSIISYYYVSITAFYKLLYKILFGSMFVWHTVFGLLHVLVPGKGDYVLTTYFLACLNSSLFLPFLKACLPYFHCPRLAFLGDAMDCIRWKSKIKGVTVTSGVVRDGCKLWMFLVLAHPGCPGSRAINQFVIVAVMISLFTSNYEVLPLT